MSNDVEIPLRQQRRSVSQLVSYSACSEEGCEKPHRARGLCGTHYYRFRNSSEFTKADRPPIGERFWTKVSISAECWEWRGSLSPGGYGQFSIKHGQSPAQAHRWAYESARGAIPDGLVLDHLCRNRACVRPDHLEVVTNAENKRRGESLPAVNARRTHCQNGHEFTPDNTYIRREGHRQCRTCAKVRAAKRRTGRPPGRPRQAHCKRGHEFTAEKTYISREGVRTCRTCVLARAKRYALRKKLSRSEGSAGP